MTEQSPRTSFFEIASMDEDPKVQLIPAPLIDELEGFEIEPSRVQWGGKGITLRHDCGWHICVVTLPSIGAIDAIQTMQMHLLMNECEAYRKKKGK